MYEKFMPESMKKEYEKIEREKKKVEAKEKNHKKRLRELRTHIICNWGGTLDSVFSKEGISLDSTEIAGMAIEALSELKKDPELRKSWAEKGSKFFSKKSKNRKEEGVTLTISFPEKPTTETLAIIKKQKFKYSSPFKMWYKKEANQEQKQKIEEALKDTPAEVKMIGNLID